MSEKVDAATPEALEEPAETPGPTTQDVSGEAAGGSTPKEHFQAIQPMTEQLREPQSFRDLVSQSIENQPSLGWEKKLLARWAQRKRK